ncbi:hypothetical protein TSMEX_008126 [Taenia solium]|eukprot:TsM_000901500 transcript=TsM_000901500 gene=TsM_000901500
MQLESLVSIQSEIINYLSNNEHSDKNHPLLEVSKRLQESLISTSSKDKSTIDNKTYQNIHKNCAIDAIGAEHSKASEQLHSFDLEVSIQPEDNENNGNARLGQCKPPAVNATFERNSNTWKNPMEVPLFLVGGHAGDHFTNGKLTSKKRYTTHFSLPRAITPKSIVKISQRLENDAGDRIISSDSTDSDSAGSISSEFEIEVVTPPKQITGNGVHQSVTEKELPRMTGNSNVTTLVDPIAKNHSFCEWVSNQRNNNKRVERSGAITERAMHQLHPDMQVSRRDTYNYNLTDFIKACHLLQQSLESPKSVSPSQMVKITASKCSFFYETSKMMSHFSQMDAMPILREYWFHNTTSSDVTVESFEAFLSVISQFPPSVAGRVVNQRDKEGRTFLHIAVRKRLWRLIEMALEECREFDLDRTDACGRTPLILMVFYASQHHLRRPPRPTSCGGHHGVVDAAGNTSYSQLHWSSNFHANEKMLGRDITGPS